MAASMLNEPLRTNDERDSSRALAIEFYDFGIMTCSAILMACSKESAKCWKALALSHFVGEGIGCRLGDV
jgi:hypothetical protein